MEFGHSIDFHEMMSQNLFSALVMEVFLSGVGWLVIIAFSVLAILYFLLVMAEASWNSITSCVPPDSCFPLS
ncbi:hypothetical protein Syun_024351 [Stephania yunnanensis]|uniref:Uncharacterized protein n=1 Tax=Stephania yunnanensis TaxID=152371 RepID=A0AAP0NJ12_9MAGN